MFGHLSLSHTFWSGQFISIHDAIVIDLLAVISMHQYWNLMNALYSLFSLGPITIFYIIIAPWLFWTKFVDTLKLLCWLFYIVSSTVFLFSISVLVVVVVVVYIILTKLSIQYYFFTGTHFSFITSYIENRSIRLSGASFFLSYKHFYLVGRVNLPGPVYSG